MKTIALIIPTSVAGGPTLFGCATGDVIPNASIADDTADANFQIPADAQ